MDSLSDLLADVRIRGAVFARTRLGSAGHLAVHEALGDALGEAALPCFHLVTEGRVWLHPGDGSEPTLLKAGDVAFFPRGSAHRLTGQAPLLGLAPRRTCVGTGEMRASGATLVESFLPGSLDQAVGRTLSGSIQIQGWRRRGCGGLPPWLTLQWGEQTVPQWLTIGLTYLDQELSRERLARQAVIDRLGDIFSSRACAPT